MQKVFDDIADFHRALEHPIGERPTALSPERMELRKNLIIEEVNELLCAMLGVPKPIRKAAERVLLGLYDAMADKGDQDLVEMADGMADAVYVIIGTAVEAGLPMGEVWDEVQRANMAKAGGPKREDGKTLRPEGWRPPDIETILFRHGWQPPRPLSREAATAGAPRPTSPPFQRDTGKGNPSPDRPGNGTACGSHNALVSGDVTVCDLGSGHRGTHKGPYPGSDMRIAWTDADAMSDEERGRLEDAERAARMEEKRLAQDQGAEPPTDKFKRVFGGSA